MYIDSYNQILTNHSSNELLVNTKDFLSFGKEFNEYSKWYTYKSEYIKCLKTFLNCSR